MNKNPIVFATLLVAAGCGAQTASRPVHSSSPTPSATATTAPTFPAGIYVAVHEGDDSQSGDALHPLKSIDTAIQRAIAAETRDVWIIGGGSDEHIPEIVVDRGGVNLHGSVCFPTTPDVFRQSREHCATTLDAGSPSLVVRSSQPVTIDDLYVVGRFDPTQPATGFELPGEYCVAATNVALPVELTACDRLVDHQNRPLPRPRIGVVVENSQAVTFQYVGVTTERADDGVAGEPGIDGEWGADANGPIAGQNPACPSANGGNGGRGGRLYADGTMSPAEPGLEPGSTVAATGTVPFFWNVVRGADAASGDLSVGSSEYATAGSAGSAALDPMLLVSGSGTTGAHGVAGVGGAGAAGGAAANRLVYSYVNTQYILSKVSGSVPSSIRTSLPRSVAVTSGLGEQDGGNGGGGGAGGCGGAGGEGGQGGAVTIGILLLDGSSVKAIGHTSITADAAGRGGAGGVGGEGGQGGGAGFGTNGGSVDATAPGTMNADGTWSPTQPQAIFNQLADVLSPSIGGSGGIGSRGRFGQSGGNGGSGAAGQSHAIVTRNGGTLTDDGSGYFYSADATTLSL